MLELLWKYKVKNKTEDRRVAEDGGWEAVFESDTSGTYISCIDKNIY